MGASEIDMLHMKKEDFYLLMESYRNTIELNTTLIERVEALLRQNDAMLTGQKEVMETITGFKNEVHEEIHNNRNTVLQHYTEVRNRLNLNSVASASVIISLIGLVILIIHTLTGG